MRSSTWFVAALVSILAALVFAGAAAADPPQLTGQRTSAGFYPCTDPQDATPPTLADCVGALPLDVQVTGSCNPSGNSTMMLTATGGASGTFNGTYEETIIWTIGPQANPAVPAFFPFAGAPPAESVGLLTGEVTSLTASFTITAGGTTIQGTKSLVPNAGNWGVCRQFTDEDLEGPVFGGPAPHTGEIYILGAGVLSYDVTSGIAPESGLSESYLMNSYATCCNSASPSNVSSATGHLQEGFGTTHPAAGTSGSATAPESAVPTTVEPLPEVEITFPSVGAGGASVTAVLTTSVPALPAGFQVGDPPAFYELAATGAGVFPVVVCIGYGAVPAGTTPKLLHYEGGVWVDKTDEVLGPPDNKVCGDVDSFSPFAALYEPTVSYTLTGPFQPVDPLDTVNTVRAGRTVPVKFSLGGDFGLDVIADGYPTSVGGPCDAGPTDAIETTSNGAGLTYDAASGVYSYHWKTLNDWAGHCRTLIIQFDDGSELRADFKFN